MSTALCLTAKSNQIKFIIRPARRSIDKKERL